MRALHEAVLVTSVCGAFLLAACGSDDGDSGSGGSSGTGGTNDAGAAGTGGGSSGSGGTGGSAGDPSGGSGGGDAGSAGTGGDGGNAGTGGGSAGEAGSGGGSAGQAGSGGGSAGQAGSAGASGGGAAGSAGSPVDPNEGIIKCGENKDVICTLPDQICCQGLNSAQCKPASESCGFMSATITCDGPEDCSSSSEMCCAKMDMAAMSAEAVCTTSCAGTMQDAIMCHDTEDCPGSMTCKLCQPPGGPATMMCVTNDTCP